MMTTTFRRHAAKGFTLIELLIVVIIIAILAAIAIPQFSNSSGDAQESAAVANLTTMRSAIELYRAQHNGNYPSRAPVGAAPVTACAGVAGAAADNDPATMVAQLTMFSSASGHTCSVATAGYIYGPYLRAIPVEPVTGVNTITIALNAAAEPSTLVTTGWRFVNATGALNIHSLRLARDGTTTLAAR
jgi:general secretion pathway protein G